MTCEKLKKMFESKGWKNVNFEELAKEEAERKGLLFALYSKEKYYIMKETGNIYHSNGRIAHFNLNH